MRAAGSIVSGAIVSKIGVWYVMLTPSQTRYSGDTSQFRSSSAVVARNEPPPGGRALTAPAPGAVKSTLEYVFDCTALAPRSSGVRGEVSKKPWYSTRFDELDALVLPKNR